MEVLGNDTVCRICNKMFLHSAILKRHLNKVHYRTKRFSCSICGHSFSQKINFLRHWHVHKRKKTAKCPLCNFRNTKNAVTYHISSTHKVDMETEKIEFNSLEEFEAWKVNYEIRTGSKYTRHNGLKSAKDGSKRIIHECSRGKGYRHTGNSTQTNLLGTNKILSYCPSRIEVIICKNSTIKVTLWNTHVGHETEAQRLTQNEYKKERIVAQLHSNVPVDRIPGDAQNYVNNSSGTPVPRYNFLTRHDLFNIERDFNSKSKTIHHLKDCVSIDSWIKKMKLDSDHNPVRFYKPQGITFEEYPLFEKDDFLLIISNNAQVDLLQKFGTYFICIDRSIGCTSSGIHCSTVFILDESHQAIPCSFLFSTRTDTALLEFYFRLINDMLGNTICASIFMSDMDDSIFDSWCTIMGKPNTRLYSPWNVEEDWMNNLSKIHSKEKQDYTHKLLKTLAEETDLDSFSVMLAITCSSLCNVPDTKDFAMYFERFRQSSEYWARYYRLVALRDADAGIESIHRFVTYMCQRLEAAKQLDGVIHEIMGFLKSELYDPLSLKITENAELNLPELWKAHNRAVKCKQNVIECDGCWLVSSADDGGDVYSVQPRVSDCDCKLKCKLCCSCIHSYVCVCTDFVVKWNMCEHIHTVCRYIKSSSNAPVDIISMLNWSQDSRETSKNFIAETSCSEENQESTQHILKEVLPSSILYTPHANADLTLQQTKELLKEKFSNLIDSIEFEEQCLRVDRVVPYLTAVLKDVKERHSSRLLSFSGVIKKRRLGRDRKSFPTKENKSF